MSGSSSACGARPDGSANDPRKWFHQSENRDMKKVSEDDHKDFISWAKANTANRVYPCSIAEGFQSGDIYVNDGDEPEAALFWHYCGFGYISGKASEEFLSEVYEEMTSGLERRLVLITADDDVIAYFRDKDVLMDSRAEYAYLPKGEPGAAVESGNADVAADFQIEQIDAGNISKIGGRIIPSFSWESPEQFLKEGFGYVVLDRGRVCAVAFSAAVSSDEIDIGVETVEDHRRMGLAAMLADRMCRHITGLGKKPVWAHSISNKGSMNTALKCGFVQDRINTVIKKK